MPFRVCASNEPVLARCSRRSTAARHTPWRLTVPKTTKKGQRYRKQYAALPLQCDADEACVVLVTSRETGRWVIPKGWPEKGLSAAAVAAKEAFEEAGLIGSVSDRSIGTYVYDKRLANGRIARCEVEVFPFVIEAQADAWPEQAEREVRWCTV